MEQNETAVPYERDTTLEVRTVSKPYSGFSEIIAVFVRDYIGAPYIEGKKIHVYNVCKCMGAEGILFLDDSQKTGKLYLRELKLDIPRNPVLKDVTFDVIGVSVVKYK